MNKYYAAKNALTDYRRKQSPNHRTFTKYIHSKRGIDFYLFYCFNCKFKSIGPDLYKAKMKYEQHKEKDLRMKEHLCFVRTDGGAFKVKCADCDFNVTYRSEPMAILDGEDHHICNTEFQYRSKKVYLLSFLDKETGKYLPHSIYVTKELATKRAESLEKYNLGYKFIIIESEVNIAPKDLKNEQ